MKVPFSERDFHVYRLKSSAMSINPFGFERIDDPFVSSLSITEVSPLSGKTGDIVTITGILPFSWKGTWSVAQSYSLDDAVMDNDTFYISRGSSTGMKPGSGHAWELFSSILVIKMGYALAPLYALGESFIQVLVPHDFETGLISILREPFIVSYTPEFNKLYGDPSITLVTLAKSNGVVYASVQGVNLGDVQSVTLFDQAVPFEANSDTQLTVELDPHFYPHYSGYGLDSVTPGGYGYTEDTEGPASWAETLLSLKIKTQKNTIQCSLGNLAQTDEFVADLGYGF